MEKSIEREMLEFKGSSEAKLENIEKTLDDFKNNHFAHIYKELKNITAKLSSKRPSWTVSTIITILVSVTLLLLREVIR